MSPAFREPVNRLLKIPHHEFWPAWLFYLPLIPLWLWLTIRYRHPLAFTACNPAIGAGGGVVGESKFEIMRLLGAVTDSPPSPTSPLAATYLIPASNPGNAANASERREAVQHLIAQHELNFPVIIKPDDGYRGRAVRLVRSAADIERALTDLTADAVLQPFHPGPHEYGVLWARAPETDSANSAANRPFGRILSITVKQFSCITGDGCHTLEELILAHSRYRFQAATFLARHSAHRHRILNTHESLALAVAGNHCQGTLFRDGAHLITPELAAAIDAIAARFPDLDFGRFDIRATSESDFRAGRLDSGSIIELNGSTAESTNIYDPDRSIFFAYRYLSLQWRTLYALGARRWREGSSRPLGILELLRMLREHRRTRSRSSLSD